MTRILPSLAFAAGLAAVAWIGSGYLGSSPLALAVTALIAAFYLVGGAELRRFAQATHGLTRALADLHETPAQLDPWLARLPAGLRLPVRLRIEGERVALPAPALTPYLAGLLVLLGMLGTFVGMVVTLRGTGAALDGAADIATIRASLSAPVQGLGLAFGTSIAGVAASAMLGLAATLCRRERMLATAALDGRIAGPLRVFGAAHRRDEWWRSQQEQARALPALVERIGALTESLAAQGAALNDRLLAGQDRFHAGAETVYTGLAASVDRSLQDSLVAATRRAAEALQPVVQATMDGIARDAEQMHRALGGTLERFGEHFDARAAALAAQVGQDTRRLLDGASAALGEHGAALARDLARQHGEAQADTLRTLGAATDAQLRHTIDEVTRLAQASAEAPRAAAEAIAELRRQVSDGLVRDNAMLDERARLLASLDTVITAVNHGASEQRASIDALVAGAAGVLERVGDRFEAQVQAHRDELGTVAAQVVGGAVEVASLGEAFGGAVQQFGAASVQLGAQLERIEAALARSTARSDEQLAYYVAQARELIDLSLLSQKRVVDDLQRLAARRDTADHAA